MKNYHITSFLIVFLVTVVSGCLQRDEVEPKVDLMVNGNGNDTESLRGVDEWGWNWQAHQFVGTVFNAMIADYAYQDADFYKWDPYQGDDGAYLSKYPEAESLPFWQYRNMKLVMHWNESLITSEGVYQDWLDSDAWISFHYQLGSGKDKWSEFQKFVAVKSTDTLKEDGWWYSEDDELIGLGWHYDHLAMVMYHDAGTPPMFISPMGPGYGKYKIRIRP